MDSMKFLKILFTTSLFLQNFLSFSQTENELEAIAKYQLSEEAYSNSEYDKALAYLGQAKDIIGNKPKLLYLEIVIEIDKGYDTSERVKQILKKVELFEKSAGINNFSQDKKMLVAKNKILLKEKLNDLTIQEEKLAIEKKELDIKTKKGRENFERFTIDDLPLGQNIEEFQKQFPDILPENHKISKTKWAKGTDEDLIYAYHSKSIAFENKENFLLPYNASTGAPIYDTTIHLVLVKNGKIVGFQKTIFYYNSKGQGNLTYSEATSEVTKYVEKFNADFASDVSKTNGDMTYYTYGNQWSWIIPDAKGVHLYSDNYMDEKNPRRWKSSLTLRVFKDYK